MSSPDPDWTPVPRSRHVRVTALITIGVLVFTALFVAAALLINSTAG